MGSRDAAIFIGNRIFGDDRIGLVVGEALKSRLEELGVDVYILETTGFSLLDYIEGYDRAFLVDSVCKAGSLPGSVLTLSVDEFKTVKSQVPHFSGVVEMMDLMKELGMELPNICIIGVSVEDSNSFREGLSEHLRPMTDAISRSVYAKIAARLGGREA